MKGVLLSVMAAGLLRTVAETSDYKSTSRDDDVIAFIRAAQTVDPDIRVENFAVTTEGRALPLVIVGSETGGRWLGGYDRSIRAMLLGATH